MKQIQSEGYDEFPDDSQWYLSQMIAEETREIAEAMYNEGMDDETIGKTIRHHIHDKREEGGLTVFTLKNDSSSDSYGVVTIVPNTSWYQKLFPETETQDSMDTQLMFFGVPDHKDVIRLAEDEVLKRGWSKDQSVIYAERAKGLQTATEHATASVRGELQ